MLATGLANEGMKAYGGIRAKRAPGTADVAARAMHTKRCPSSRSSGPVNFQVPSSDQALPVTARRAKRENGSLGEDPPGSTLTY
jgi:hypothetical protein